MCGVYGAGKTVLARQIAAVTDLPFHDYDDNRESAKLRRVVAGEKWVIAGSERRSDSIVWAQSDLVIWLDPPFAMVLARVVRRALDRNDQSGVWDARTHSRSRRNLLKPRLLLRALRRRRIRRADFASTPKGQAAMVRIRPADVPALLESLACGTAGGDHTPV